MHDDPVAFKSENWLEENCSEIDIQEMREWRLDDLLYADDLVLSGASE